MPWLGPAVWTGGLVPLLVLALDAGRGALGANPLERVLEQSGVLALLLLVLSLACTPLRRLTGWTWPARIRRELGLLAFAYGALHLLVYLLDQGGLGGLSRRRSSIRRFGPGISRRGSGIRCRRHSLRQHTQ